MKIVIFEAEPRDSEIFARITPPHTVTLVKEPLCPENAASYADAEIVSPFIYSKLDQSVLARLTAVKFVTTRSTGYDHIDVRYCREHGIAVSNVPSYGENTVAEHVFALLLAVTHRLPESVERARSGHFSPEGLEGVDLAGKTFGVIGTGNIGRHVVRIARGFAMNVVAYDVRPNLELAIAMGFRYADLDELLAMSDVISLHVPASPETNNLLSASEFARMKDGVIVINTARGNVIDTQALIMGLRSGKIGGAGLDVLPDEPLIREEAELISSIYEGRHDLRNLVAEHILLHMPNVIITPHSAFNTREAIQRIAVTTVENIQAFLRGDLQNAVNHIS